MEKEKTLVINIGEESKDKKVSTKKIIEDKNEKEPKTVKKKKLHYNLFALVLYAISCIGVSIGSAFIHANGFVKEGASLSNEYYEKVNYIEKTPFDYQVFSPIEEQIESMKKEASIDKLFAYHRYNASIKKDNATYPDNTYAIFSADKDNLSITPYNADRVVEGDFNVSDGYALVDRSIANSLNLKVNDSFELSLADASGLSFKVGAILDDNKFFERPTVYFHLSNTVKAQLIEGYPKLNYYGIMIKAKDSRACYDYLKGYKPLGEFLTREYFDTDDEYEAYYERMIKTDYSGNIFNRQIYYEQNQEAYASKLAQSDNKLTLGLVLGCILNIVVAIAGATIITILENNNAKITGNAASKSVYFISFATTSVLVGVLAGSISCALIGGILSSTNVYATFSAAAYRSGVLLGVISGVVSLVATSIISLFVSRSK